MIAIVGAGIIVDLMILLLVLLRGREVISMVGSKTADKLIVVLLVIFVLLIGILSNLLGADSSSWSGR